MLKKLDKKLTHQFEVYGKMSQLLLNKLRQKELFTREEWESTLNQLNEDKLTPDEIDLLKQLQQNLIIKYHRFGSNFSRINLDKIRSHFILNEFIDEFPIGGNLHVHSAGTLDKNFIQKILINKNVIINKQNFLQYYNRPDIDISNQEFDFLNKLPPEIPYKDLSTIDKSCFLDLFFLPVGVHKFPRFEAVFSPFIWLCKTAPLSPQEIWCEYFKKASEQRILHIEFTDPAIWFENTNESLQNLKDLAEKEYGLSVVFNFGFFRTTNIAQNIKILQNILEHKNVNTLDGVDIFGEETSLPLLENTQELFGNLLSRDYYPSKKIFRSVHAGEMGDVKNPRDAMLLGANRIGHGVNLIHSPIDLAYAAHCSFAIDACITSNISLGVTSNIKNHPFLSMLRLGIKISLATDDDAIFDTDIRKEYKKVVQETDITYAELKQISFNSIDNAFLSPEKKQDLAQKLQKMFSLFEEKWGKYR